MATPRLNRVERYVIRQYLAVDPDEVEAYRPLALIVGEAPGPNTSDHCPMLPYPPRSAGGRLMAMSGLSNRDYLCKFHRVNLLASFPGASWPRAQARESATLIAGAAAISKWPIVMMGARVAEAFNLKDVATYQWSWLYSLRPLAWTPVRRPAAGVPELPIVRLPHPSGRNTVLNSPEERECVRRILQNAAEHMGKGDPL